MDEHGLLQEIGNMFEAHSEKLRQDMKRDIEVIIENNVTAKIESLFDGYKLAHEKQWELQHRVEILEQAIEDIRNRTA